MKLYYYRYKSRIGNFGDDLNLWLWEKLLPGLFDNNQETIFVGIGTLLNHRMPKSKKTIIFGTGVGYGNPPKVQDGWKIYCLRGPLSAKALGVSSYLAITDPALLVRKYFKPEGAKKHKFSYMPHRANVESGCNSWASVCKDLGFGYIDPRDPVEQVLLSISSTECLITEAMHGAIIADALRIPWIPISTTKEIFVFKWKDWCSSLALDYNSVNIMPLWDLEKNPGLLKLTKLGFKKKWVAYQLNAAAKRGTPILSKQSLSKILSEKLESKVACFKTDVENGLFHVSFEKCLK